MLNITVITSYIFSVLSFILFLFLAMTRRTVSHPEQTKPEGLADVKPQGAISDMAKLVEALAKLTDSFAKAGPMVMALVAAIFFLLIAVIGSGLDSAVTVLSR
jgi:hypothetical protein